MTGLPAAPDLSQLALLLDVDGTIVDIAPTPREAFVPASLRQTLERLLMLTDGALALVSGRTIADLDLMFAPLRLPAVGAHGAEIRARADGTVGRPRVQRLPDDLERQLAVIAAAGPGILLEKKPYSLAIHYRLAPDKEQMVRDAVIAICRELAPDTAEMLPGKLVLEIKATGFDKGTGVRRLMAHPPFKHRTPLFIGDDTTDEAAVAVLGEFNGLGFSVGRAMAGATRAFERPSEVRAWLERLSPVDAAPAQ